MRPADGIDRSMTKNEIRDYLLEQARLKGVPMSKSRANNLADKYKKGHISEADLVNRSE